MHNIYTYIYILHRYYISLPNGVFEGSFEICKISESAVKKKYWMVKPMLDSINTTVLQIYYIYCIELVPETSLSTEYEILALHIILSSSITYQKRKKKRQFG